MAELEHTPDGVIVLNDSGEPDEEVLKAVQDYMTDTSFIETAGLTPPPTTAFQMYAAEGNLLSRRHWQAPRNVIEEIKLARDLADTDDACAGAIAQLVAAAFKHRMRHLHPDEKTEVLFNKLAKKNGLDRVFKEMYREILIASSVTTVTGFTTEELRFTLDDVDRMINQSVVGPRIGVFPAENIRIKGSDVMGLGTVCYKPSSYTEEQFLEEYFSDRTSEPRKRVMRQLNPFLLSLLIGRVEEDPDTAKVFIDDFGLDMGAKWIYPMNPRMVHRTTFAKGAAKYPRPLLTGNFALLEAKRLLNVMDYSLLQGGSNYIVVAKKGSDARPARKNEITQLARTVQAAGKTGVIVGDHRLSIEILTPNLEALLNTEKRDMVDRKLAQRILRTPDRPQANAENSKNEMEIMQAVVTSDRDMLVRHVEDSIYEEVVTRNGRTFSQGAPTIWFPLVVLAGLDVFLQGLLKLRDRGDIPRAYGVEFFGYDMQAAVRERARERSRGDDRVMTPPVVPHDSPGNRPPADNGPGRPPGAPTRPAAERITAVLEGDRLHRVGEVTYRVLEQHRETARGTDPRHDTRISTNERALLDQGGGTSAGVHVAVVNPDLEVGERMRAVRLRDGVSMIVGRTLGDNAIVAKALIFRDPEFTEIDVKETAMRWGFELAEPEPDPSA